MKQFKMRFLSAFLAFLLTLSAFAFTSVLPEAVAEGSLSLKKGTSLVIDGEYVRNVRDKTSAETLASCFSNENVTIVNESGIVLSGTAAVGTGCIVAIYEGGVPVESLTVVVLGDVTGEGNIDTTDYLRIKSNFLGTLMLSGVYVLAGDVDENGVIDGTDYMRIKGYFLDLYDIFPEFDPGVPDDSSEEVSDEPSHDGPNVDESGNVLYLYGSGTESDPYTVSSQKELEYFAANYADSAYAGKEFKLTDDIVWSDYISGTATSNWTPIGTEAAPFNGTFDGNGKTISGIYCSGAEKLGFFGYAAGTIKDLTIDKSAFVSSGNKTAAFVSTLAGDLTITGCVNRANVQGTKYVSGIVSFNNTAGRKLVVSNCVNYGNISVVAGTEDCVAGIVGYAGAGENTIGWSINYGTITGGDKEGTDMAGGIVGKSANGTTFIYRCENYGAINGTNQMGGIAGHMATGSTADYCYNGGAVTSAEGIGVGGIVGRFVGGCVSNTLNSGKVTITSKTSSQWGEIAGDCGKGGLSFADVPAATLSGCHYVKNSGSSSWTKSTTDAYALSKGWSTEYSALRVFVKGLYEGTITFPDASTWKAAYESENYAYRLTTPCGNGLKVMEMASLKYFSTGSYGKTVTGEFSDSSHQDGHVFTCGDNLYIIDGGEYETGKNTLYQYLINRYEDKYGTETYISGKKLDINIIISHFHTDHIDLYTNMNAQGQSEGFLTDPRFNVVNIYYPDLKVERRYQVEALIQYYHSSCKIHVIDFKEYTSFSAGPIKFELYASPYDWSSTTSSDIVSGKTNSEWLVELYGADATAAPENSNSMWVKMTYGNYTMLFTGDSMKRISYRKDANEPFDVMLQYWMEKRGEDVFKVDILKYIHHGNLRKEAMRGVLDHIDPDFMIFTSVYKEYMETINTPLGLMYQGAYAGTQENGILIRFKFDGTVTVNNKDTGETVTVFDTNGNLATTGDLFRDRIYNSTKTTELLGEGTEKSPYLISSADDLAFFAMHYYEDKYVGKYFKLTNDIVWSESAASFFASSKVTGMDSSGNLTWSKALDFHPNWVAIGSFLDVCQPFVGTFDGDGHTVSGIYGGPRDGIGFFGAVDGTVKNLTIKDSLFLGRRIAGAIVAHVGDKDTVYIENCVNYATVFAKMGAGGIFSGCYGTSANGEEAPLTGSVHITKCVNYGDIYGGSKDANSSVGGIVGSFRYMGESSLTYCANYGNVQSNGGCVGGIIGQATACVFTMNNCVNQGNVTGLRLVGGIIGKSSHEAGREKTYSNLCSTGNVKATSPDHSQVGYINGSASGDAGHQDAFDDGTFYYLSTAKLTNSGTGTATGDIPSIYTAKSQSEITKIISGITAKIPAIG